MSPTRAWVGAWAWAASTIAAGGCGTSDGGGGGGPTDASADHAAAQDAQPEGEAGGSGDAGADAKPEAEAGAQTWCDTQSPRPAFCEDFDRGALGTSWDAVVQTPGSAIALDQASFVSAPQSLFAQSKAASSGQLGSVLLRKTVSVTATRVRLAFDFKGDPAPASGGPVGIATLDVTQTHLFTLYLHDEGLDGGAGAPALVEQVPGGGSSRHPFTLPPIGGFTRVELDVDLAAQKATVRFGGTAVLDQVSVAGGTATEATIRVGVLATGPQSAYAARFDNLTVVVQ